MSEGVWKTALKLDRIMMTWLAEKIHRNVYWMAGWPIIHQLDKKITWILTSKVG